MDIDWEKFAEVLKDDLQYVRDHLVKIGVMAAVGVGVGMFVAGWVGAILLAAGVGHSFYAWIAAVIAADGDEEKLNEARTSFVHFLEAFVMAGGIRLLRAGRSGRSAPAEQRGGVPQVWRPRRGANVASTVSAGQVATRALEGPDPDLFDSEGRAIVPAPSGGSQTFDRTSGSGPGGDFVAMSSSFFSSIRSLNGLAPDERFRALQKTVATELDAYFAPSPVYRQGNAARFIVKEWALVFPSAWMHGRIGDGADLAGELADLVNQVIEYWTVALRMAESPTLRAFGMRHFPDRVAFAAEQSQGVLPSPVRDSNRAASLTFALHARLDWDELQPQLAQARSEYAEPTTNWMIEALESNQLSVLGAAAEQLKATIAEHGDSIGSTRASQWASRRYKALVGIGPTVSTPAAQLRPFRTDKLDFNAAFFSQMAVMRLDWAYPDIGEEQRCQWLGRLLNAQLGQWGVPRFHVVSGETNDIDRQTWTLVISQYVLVPEMAGQWQTVHELLAYQGAKALQHWKILKYRLRAEPGKKLELEFPRSIVEVAKTQPVTDEEMRTAKTLHESLFSPGRIVATEQMEQATAEVRASEEALMEAEVDLEMAGDYGKADAADLVALAAERHHRATQKHIQISNTYAQRPEERDALDVVDRTVRRARGVGSQ